MATGKKETSRSGGFEAHHGIAAQPSAEEEVLIDTIATGMDLAKRASLLA
ncbi:hypothetical protein [Dokdonella sp.]|nr:hypothetical protein [Dokdonella sp.]MBX3688167.1 hypothetical protein [Dokdonella sp.]